MHWRSGTAVRDGYGYGYREESTADATATRYHRADLRQREEGAERAAARAQGAAERRPLEASVEQTAESAGERPAHQMRHRRHRRVVAGHRVVAHAFVKKRHEFGREPAAQAVQLAHPTVLVLLRDDLRSVSKT